MSVEAAGPARRPWWFWTCWAVGIAALAALTLHARFTTDLQKSLPRDDPDLNRILAFLQERGSSRMMALEAWADPPATTDDAQAALLAIQEAIRPLGATMLPQPGPDAVARMVDTIETHLPALVTPEQLDEVAARMQPERLADYLAALKERASRPDDAFSGTAARFDVLAVGGGPMLELQRSAGGAAYENGIVRHPDGKHLLLPLTVGFDPGEMRSTAPLMRALEGECARWRARGVTVEPIGSYRHFDDNMSSLYVDFFSTIPLGVGLIVLVLWSLARSWRGVLTMYVPAALGLLGAIATIAVLSARDGAVPLPLIGFAASLMGVAVDYGVQMTFALRETDSRHVHRPLMRSFIVTACAFGALAFSPVPALHSLGVMVLVGIAVAYLAARTLLPAAVRPRPRPDPWARVTRPLLAWCERHPGRRLLAAALITLALAPGLTHLRFLSDIQKMDGSKPATRAALEDFLARWGSLEPSNYVVATDATLDQALARASEVRRRLQLAPSRLETALPDAATQAARQEHWNRFWSEHGDTFARDFAAACAMVHLRPQAFAASLDRYRPVSDPVRLTLADWDGSPLATALGTLVLHLDGRWQVASPFDAPTPSASLAIADQAQRLGIEPAWIASRARLADRLVRVLREDLLARALTIAAAVTLAITLLVRAWRPVLAMLAPPSFALLWTFGLLGSLGQELTPFTILVAAFVGGIGIDCAVFLAQPEDRERLVTPVIGCICTAVAGTGAMVFARHPLLCGVGLTLTIGMTACLAASLLVTPAIAGGRGRRDTREAASHGP
jgi:predicted exporter